MNRPFAKRDKCYRAIIDALPQMVGILDAAATLRTVNTQWRTYTGAPIDDRGVPTGGLPVHADDLEAAAAMLAAIGPNCDLHCELRMRRADATYRRHDVRVIPLDAQDKRRADRWLMVCTDIESQSTIVSRLGVLAKQLTFDNASDKASTVRLREKTQLMAIVERMAHLGHWRLDLNSDKLFLSDELRRTFGLAATFTPTLPKVIACYHPQDREYVRADIQDAVAQATTFTHEARIIRPDGAIRYVLSYGQPECASDGTVVAIVGCVQDVTAPKQLALAREHIAERISVATATARVGIWEYSAPTDTLIWDPMMYALYGFDDGRIEQTYDGWSASLHTDDRERITCDIAQSFSRGAPYDTEFRAIWPNGEVHYIRAMATIVRGAADATQRMIGTSWDVTEMRILDEQLRHEKDQLAETIEVWTAAKVVADEAKAFALEMKVVADEAKAVATQEKVIADHAKAIAVAEKAIAEEAKMNADEAKEVATQEKAASDDTHNLMVMAEEMAHYGHWRIDLISNEVRWSDEVCRIHGVPTSFKPSIDTALANCDPDGPDIRGIVQRATIDGKPFSYEARIRHSDNTLRDVRCFGRGQRDENGALTALVGIFQDITNLKNAQRVRDKIAERVSVATQAEKVGGWEWDTMTAALTWDPLMYALYGLDESSTTPSYEMWIGLLTLQDRERVIGEFNDALSGSKRFNSMFRIMWPNGEIHTIRAQATVLRNAANEPERMVGINWDITEIRSLADQISNEETASHASERERLYQHERQWSATFQRAVLPAALPDVAGCTFDAVYEPGFGEGQVGGDWYDAVHLSDGRILVSIGDVAGSGLRAAVVVGVARQIIRGISQIHADPMLILDAADRALSLEYPGVYVSAWVGLIDLVTRTVTYASAGHPLPLLVSRDGTVRELDDATTMLIGMRTERHGKATTVSLAQGDALVLYTDGITEAGRDLIAGTCALTAAAARFAAAPSLHPALAIKAEVIPKGSPDDAALLVVRTDFREVERFIERWTFDVRDVNAATDARNKFVRSLASSGFSAAACADAEVVFGELIGNVVRHVSAAEVEVAINYGGAETVLHVFDHGGGFNHISRLPRDPYAENGRGLFLIAALTDEFTVSERPDGGSHARAVLVRIAA